MGLFLSLTSIVGKTKQEVVDSLGRYASAENGSLRKEELPIEDDDCCVITESNGNTTIFNPYSFTQWDDSAEFISKDLQAPVFSFHIHDSDLWMYIMHVNGQVVDQYNPLPGYWDTVDREEMESWKGNASIVSKHIRTTTKEEIEKYLVPWKEEDGDEKAYPDDEYGREDWQLLDFMRRLHLPYPLHDDGSPADETYRFHVPEKEFNADEEDDSD